jgi:hypothetical protein
VNRQFVGTGTSIIAIKAAVDLLGLLAWLYYHLAALQDLQLQL